MSDCSYEGKCIDGLTNCCFVCVKRLFCKNRCIPVSKHADPNKRKYCTIWHVHDIFDGDYNYSTLGKFFYTEDGDIDYTLCNSLRSTPGTNYPVTLPGQSLPEYINNQNVNNPVAICFYFIDAVSRAYFKKSRRYFTEDFNVRFTDLDLNYFRTDVLEYLYCFDISQTSFCRTDDINVTSNTATIPVVLMSPVGKTPQHGEYRVKLKKDDNKWLITGIYHKIFPWVKEIRNPEFTI